jgi:hypothetical protein
MGEPSALRDNRRMKTAGQVFEPRNDFFYADRGDVQFWHIGREIGVTFIGADDHAASFGDGKIAAGHTGERLDLSADK